MRMIHYLILGLPAVLPACAANPVRCDGRLQPVNPPAAVGAPPASAPAAPAAPVAPAAVPAPTAPPVAPAAAPARAQHAPQRSTP
jgi:hypothetical protein